uniref:(northern house mosquito) hypothetical protein n=1 Tax=Culex pipiens TaxID=7175 RepID=A0A8D8CA64_CULPI
MRRNLPRTVKHQTPNTNRFHDRKLVPSRPVFRNGSPSNPYFPSSSSSYTATKTAIWNTRQFDSVVAHSGRNFPAEKVIQSRTQLTFKLAKILPKPKTNNSVRLGCNQVRTRSTEENCQTVCVDDNRRRIEGKSIEKNHVEHVECLSSVCRPFDQSISKR